MLLLTARTQRSGYPTFEAMSVLKEKNFFEYLHERFTRFPYKKESDDVCSELNYLAKINKEVKVPKSFDSDSYLGSIYLICGNSYKHKHDELLKNIFLLCVRLSYHYQRPRPHVACMTYNIPVCAVNSEWLTTPSYPNPFLCGAKLVMLIEEDKDADKKLKNAAMLFMAAGWHYPSDNGFAQSIAEIIFQDNYFQQIFKQKK